MASNVSISRVLVVWSAAIAVLGVALQFPAEARQAIAAGCRVTGQITSQVAAMPAPFGGRGRGGAPQADLAEAPTFIAAPVSGATIVVRQGERVVTTTAAGADGRFTILLTPEQSFRVAAEMTAFEPSERDVSLGVMPCDTQIDFSLPLLPASRTLLASSSSASAPGTPGSTPGAAPASTGGFTQLAVTADPAAALTLDASTVDSSAELARLLPPGFTVEGAGSDALSLNARGDAINVDRSALNDRLGAIGRGEFDPTTGQFSAGFAPLAPEEGFGQIAGRGGAIGGGGRGGPGGPGGFALGGRGGRGQRPYQGSINYGFGGSSLDSTNYQPRNGEALPVDSQPYARNNYGATFGGPIVIPGVYRNTNRRTSFQFNYTGSHNTSAQDQYATVHTLAMRSGDFSASSATLLNPFTSEPLAGNRIPGELMSPAALALLAYIPEPNVEGATTQNLHSVGTTLSTSNGFNVRVNHNFSPNLPQRGAGPGGRGGGFGGGPGGAGRGGRGGRGLSINLSAQVQYRRNDAQQFNVLPSLAGTSESSSLAMPVTLTVSRNRTNHSFSVNVARNRSTSANGFSNVTDVAGLAGIEYPSTQDALNWGVPSLSFSNLNVRLASANTRRDLRTTYSYTLSKPVASHVLRYGAELRRDASSSLSNGNARGTYTFTGLYTGGGALVSGNTGADFADFLLGLPQQATLQSGGEVTLRQKSFAVYLEDNWQRSPRMTLNLGLRWEVPFPYTEANGRMANLDVTPDFTAASVVTPSQTGANSNATFPAALVNTDWNNIGPRIGAAFRIAPRTVLNTSYSITYNTASYSSIAQQLVAQPPFAEALTNAGTADDPLRLESALLGGTSTTTNNFGIDPRYGLGMIQTWNATLLRTFRGVWNVTAGYTGTRGTSLDLLRAPNRNADGTLRIDGVDPFIWESSGGRSLLSLGSFSLQRAMVGGLRFGATYTLAKSMDNASSLGAGGAVVAQNDQDLDAEYALSNFDKRHQATATATWELPFGVGRRWLADGGRLAAIAGEWSASFSFGFESGSPYTARVVGATTSVANGTSGALRADYLGLPIGLDEPTLLQFFDTTAFGVPSTGSFGSSARNVIVGPGGQTFDAQFSRDMRIGGNRSIGLTINTTNLLNTTRWTAIDTNVNSLTFGQVTRFAPRRTITLSTRIRF